MNVSKLGTIVNLGQVKPGSWFIFTSPIGRHLAWRLPDPSGANGIRFVEVVNYGKNTAPFAIRAMQAEEFPATGVLLRYCFAA